MHPAVLQIAIVAPRSASALHPCRHEMSFTNKHGNSHFKHQTWAGLLAETAIDALGHVDVIARRLAAAVLALVRFDGDRLVKTRCSSKCG